MKKFIRTILLSVFSAVLTVASIVGVVCSVDLTAKNAYASATTTWQNGLFEMNDGVSLKLSEKSGMRFIVRMDETVRNFVVNNEDAELGFIITTRQILETSNGDYANMKQVGGAIDKNKIYLEDGFYCANGCITNLQEASFELDFVAIAYISYNGEIRYTEYNSNARNNLYDLVNMSLLYGYAREVFSFETYKAWLGTKTYPILVEDSAEYDLLVDVVNQNVLDLSDRLVVVKNGVTPSYGFSNLEGKPTVLSENLFKLQELIEFLPESITMPEAIGMVTRIREAESYYKALSNSEKAQVENYEKVEGLLQAIDGYDRVYKHDADDNSVIPSYVPNNVASVGGSATTREDVLYGNVLSVVSEPNGVAALNFTNFPSITKYEKLYFYVKVDVSCDVYLSDGTGNNGWGANWKNTWSADGYWCNAGVWKLIEINPSSGYVGTDFALGFKTKTAGVTFEISDIFGVASANGDKDSGLKFGQMTDSGTTNEYGTVYNFTQGWSSNTDLGAFNVGALRSGVAAEHTALRFYIYNPNGNDVKLYFMENETWARMDAATLAAKAWTEVVITPDVIASNDTYLTYVGVESGAGTSGWKISPIYSYGTSESAGYLDHANLKKVNALINALPSSITLADEKQATDALNAYNQLPAAQQSQVSNYAKLQNALSMLEDLKAAATVEALINAINENNVDKTLVDEARAAYEALSNTQKGYVSNLALLESYEAQLEGENELWAAVANVESLIANLPDSVTMPDNLIFVPRIEAARDAYRELSAEGKGMVTNYSKLRNLLQSIKGYETIHIQTLDSVNVIPSYVPNNTAAVGGTASIGYDSYYGNYLKVTSDANGTAAIQYINLPDVSKYEKFYFNVRVSVGADIYLSDGIGNDGWGDQWNNTWSVVGLWCGANGWRQKSIEISTGIISSNLAIGFKTKEKGIVFEITDFVGYLAKEETQTAVDASLLGRVSDTGTTNEHGKVYNLTQGQWFIDHNDQKTLSNFPANTFANALPSGYSWYEFWMYNPTDTLYTFHLAGNTENGWTDSADYIALNPKEWTKVIISSADIQQNTQGDWYLYILGGANAGAAESGWQISTVYAAKEAQSVEDKLDNLQSQINGLTASSDAATVNAVREEYEQLVETEKELLTIDNLIACETALYGGVENAAFIIDGKTDYKIYLDGSDSSLGIAKAAQFMNEQLAAATGVSALPIVNLKPMTITQYRYAIVFGYEDLYRTICGAPELADFGETGYCVKRVGRTVFILAESADGYRLGVLAFLREVVGYDMISEDCVVYSGDASALPNLRIAEKADFEYRQQQTYMTETEQYGMGMQTHLQLWIPSSQGWDMHNTLHYLPTETYRWSHPSWYYDYTDSIDVDRTQICPTAGGNSTEFAAMVETIAQGLAVRIAMYPNVNNISFSIMDTGDNDDCNCSRCKLYDTLYGEGGFAAAWIDLMNAVNASLKTKIGDREVNLAFLAYRGTEKAPATVDASGNVTLMKRYQINDDGTYVQTNEDLKCDDGVAVWLAPINALYAENFNHADNAVHLATIQKWAAISNNVYLWAYGTNFKYFLYPYNTWKASAENYKILADLGVKSVWNQSIEKEGTAFTDLKGYIDSKFSFNVNSDYESVLNTYFTNYFGAAAEPMRAMFDAIVAKCDEIEANNKGLGRGIYDNIENTKGSLFGIGAKTYWSKDWVDSLIALCDEAYAAVENSNLSTEQKSAIKSRITKESLFPRYLLCTTFSDKYTSSALRTMRQEFKADCEALGVTVYREASGELSSLYSSWKI